MSPRLALACLLSVSLAAPALAQHDAGAPAPSSPPLFTDLGTWSHKVTTSSPEAQKYFDQGLRLYYGFNAEEATRAFREAARLDPGCAMAWWGVAMAAGPNINMPMDPEHAAIALEATAKARAMAAQLSASDRAYIDAITVRFSDDSRRTRAGLDSAYANAMRKLAKRYPADADARALFAESMLDLNPWNQWKHEGAPNPGTLEIVATLEAGLKKTPNHPGLNHFYIHCVEASPHPERANAAAQRLETLVPGAGHLVHMPSHIYARTGRYEDSRNRNRHAVEIDEKYIAEQKPQGMYSMMYYPHNVHFIWFSACMQGRSAEALEMARKVATLIPIDVVRQMPMLELVPPVPVLTLARFGKWDEVLREPAPPADLRYSSSLWHYARGLAFAATGRAPDAHAELDTVLAVSALVPLDQTVSINSTRMLLRIASGALAGEIARSEGRMDDAVREMRTAVAAEDSTHYDEPPTWCYPVRQMLGNVLLQAKRPKEAETVYREDLRRHPENGWSLFGLARALTDQHRAKEAAAIEARFTKAWSKSDVTLTASAF